MARVTTGLHTRSEKEYETINLIPIILYRNRDPLPYKSQNQVHFDKPHNEKSEKSGEKSTPQRQRRKPTCEQRTFGPHNNLKYQYSECTGNKKALCIVSLHLAYLFNSLI